MVQVGVAHRRELDEAQRWGVTLEAQLHAAQAALAAEQDEAELHAAEAQLLREQAEQALAIAAASPTKLRAASSTGPRRGPGLLRVGAPSAPACPIAPPAWPSAVSPKHLPLKLP